MKIYPKNLKDTEKLSTFFGEAYGEEFQTIIAREPQYTYMAYLNQTGSNAPVPQILFNNLDTFPVFAYNSTGTYDLFHPMITANKTIVTVSPGQVMNPSTVHALAFVRGPGLISLSTVDNTGNALDDELSNTLIKLEIWL